MDWSATDDLPDMVSPLCVGSSLLTLSSGGMLTCYDSRKGAVLWQHDFAPEQFRASPIAAGNRVYLTSTKGVTHVLELGSEFKEIGRGVIADEVTASAACVGNSLVVRGKRSLYGLLQRN